MGEDHGIENGTNLMQKNKNWLAPFFQTVIELAVAVGIDNSHKLISCQ